MQKQYIFKLNGVPYDVIVPEEGIIRTFQVLDTDNSGREKNGEMIRDIIGTYYNYTLQIFPNRNNPDDYYKLYNIISSPIESVEISLPYNNGWLTFNAYIANGSDMIKTMKNGNKWKGLSINFISMQPQFRYGDRLVGYSE